MRRSWIAVPTAAVAALGWGEWVNWRWSRMLVHDRRVGTLAVVVPGFRNRRAPVNAINRWRTRIMLRSVSASDGAVMIVFSGGSVGSGRSEAELMPQYARSAPGFAGQVVIEDQSHTTWENVTNVLPLVERVDRIVIASQPAHALKVRAYVRRQRPELAARVTRGADYRFGEWAPAKPFLALYGLWTLRALKPDERRIY